jgi:biotin carboxylase
VLHVEGKCTSGGPRIVEVNARMGGGRVHQFVEAVWGVDLVEAALRSCLDLPQTVRASRRPRAAAVDAIVYAPTTGRLEALPIARVKPAGCLALEVDVDVSIGAEVLGPEAVFATALAEVTLTAKDLRNARRLVAEILRDPPRVAPSLSG